LRRCCATVGKNIVAPEDRRSLRPNHHAEIEDGRFSAAHALAIDSRADPAGAKIFSISRQMLAKEIDGTAFRLMGTGVSGCVRDRGRRHDMLDRRSRMPDARSTSSQKFGHRCDQGHCL